MIPTRSVALRNGSIYPISDGSVVVSALITREGRVWAHGTDQAIESLLSPDTEVVDLGGRTVVPGLIDAHIHLEMYAQYLDLVDCEQPSVADCLDLLRKRAQATPQGAWILGHGWNQTVWGGYGTLDELDAALPDHPVYLTAKSLHAAWVNSPALKLAAIDDSTTDTEGGAVGRDHNGRPNGILYEGAMRLVADHIPSPSAEQLSERLIVAQKALSRSGLTGVHDFDGPSCLHSLQQVREQGELHLRVLKNIPVAQLGAARELGLRSGFGDEWIRIGNIKIFADGALGPRTAAMLQPYDGEPGNRGMLLEDTESLVEVFEEAAASGFGMTVHAIGDRANHEVLDAYALLRTFEQTHQLPHRRHRIEHVQVLHPDDLDRLSQLDLIASMQPIHATSDMDMADRYWGIRSELAYAWRAQLDRDVVLAFGSDAPVEVPDPILGIHAAVTRRRTDGNPGDDGWIPEQRIKIGEALRAYTAGAALAAGTETWQGKLAPGFAADLVVLDRDPFQIEADALREMQVVGTMVDGSWNYRSF